MFCSLVWLNIKISLAKSTRPPDLKYLSPTDKALPEHLLCCHLQVMTWKAALEHGPPDTDFTQWGGELSNGNINPVTGVDNIAPDDLLRTVACGCAAGKPCSREACSCKSSGLFTYCKCSASDIRENEHTKHDGDTHQESESYDDNVDEEDDN